MRTLDATAAPPLTRPRAVPQSWRDRLLAWRDRLLARPGFHRWAADFPLTRPVARRRAAQVFDLCAGFAYTQTLTACVRLDLFALLAEGPRTIEEIAAHGGLPREATVRLLRAASALHLVQPRSAGRWGLGRLGAPIAGEPGLARMIAHNALLYEDLADPLAVLRGRPDARLARHYPYAAANDGGAGGALAEADVAEYSALMAATVAPLADEVLDAYALGAHAHLLDVGGGDGAFVERVAERHPRLGLTLFDLPAVATRARARLGRVGVGARVRVVGGDFTTTALPDGADVVSLVRIVLDHDDATVLGLLRRVRAALPRGGTVLVAEPLAGGRLATVGDVYFGWYLRAMGRGRARDLAEHAALLREAGFAAPRRLGTRYPMHAAVLAATAI